MTKEKYRERISKNYRSENIRKNTKGKPDKQKTIKIKIKTIKRNAKIERNGGINTARDIKKSTE